MTTRSLCFCAYQADVVMPGLVPGIHVLLSGKDIDGRDKPGRDDGEFPPHLRPNSFSISDSFNST
jgi:hypothetical protein